MFSLEVIQIFEDYSYNIDTILKMSEDCYYHETITGSNDKVFGVCKYIGKDTATYYIKDFKNRKKFSTSLGLLLYVEE